MDTDDISDNKQTVSFTLRQHRLLQIETTYTGEKPMGIGQAFQSDWKLDIARTNNVLQLEILHGVKYFSAQHLHCPCGQTRVCQQVSTSLEFDVREVTLLYNLGKLQKQTTSAGCVFL